MSILISCRVLESRPGPITFVSGRGSTESNTIATDCATRSRGSAQRFATIATLNLKRSSRNFRIAFCPGPGDENSDQIGNQEDLAESSFAYRSAVPPFQQLRAGADVKNGRTTQGRRPPQAHTCHHSIISVRVPRQYYAQSYVRSPDASRRHRRCGFYGRFGRIKRYARATSPSLGG